MNKQTQPKREHNNDTTAHGLVPASVAAIRENGPRLEIAHPPLHAFGQRLSSARNQLTLARDSFALSRDAFALPRLADRRHDHGRLHR